MKKTLVKSMAMAFVGSLLVAGSAMALPTLTLNDGVAAPVVITDGGVGDSNPLAGVITYVGGVGANWLLNVSTGQSPVLGSLVFPHLDLNSVNNTSVGAGVMTITLSDWVTWSSGVDGIVSAAGGTTSGTGNMVSFETKVDGVSMSMLGPFTSGAFSGTDSFLSLPAGGSAQIDMIAKIIHGGKGITSFNFELTPTPEPVSMLLLGTGLVGLAGARRRKANKA